jgi:hypothetical protein
MPGDPCVKESLIKAFTELPDGTALLVHDFVLRPADL